MYRLLALLLIVVISACQNDNELGLNENEAPRTINVNDSTIEQNIDRDDSETTSNRLAELAASVPNVKHATVVALGEYAIVGIDVDKDLDRSEVGTIKYSVAETLKDDPDGAEALVVADPDITARLTEIRYDIQNGHPIQGILNELSDITGRIIPELPKHLQKTNPEEAPEEPESKINEGKENTLDKEQEDQSNNYLNEKE
ncbi:YhcN/YlaJ family sporulation lipoprotein [Bacillus coahuilensis]|uniref:YhcN/YlaJ family sporulation lipoprotein n=1 Tax=Bacillus coahuilensis TaxID=408580 RepID=UPI0001850BFF|nr:YhcN/YlaJ family sporulation lipoprotein [Bacillus coahuilensis]